MFDADKLYADKVFRVMKEVFTATCVILNLGGSHRGLLCAYQTKSKGILRKPQATSKSKVGKSGLFSNGMGAE